MVLKSFLGGKCRTLRNVLGSAGLLVCLGLTVAGFSQEPTPKPPVKVTIQDDKPMVVETVVPVEPQQHAVVNGQPNFMVSLRVDNKTMHLGTIQTVLKIDGQLH